MYIHATEPDALVEAIARVERQDGEVVAIMLAEQNRPDIERLIAGLSTADIPFFGGIFPGIISGNRTYQEGAIITCFPVFEQPYLITGLDSDAMTLPDFQGLIESSPPQPYTVLALVDGRTANIAYFLEGLFDALGSAVHYLGGGAGSIDRTIHAPCLFTAEGFVRDAALVVCLRLHSHLGVRHGWEKVLADPLVVTRAERNVIKELNWRQAFEVYRDIVAHDSHQTLTRENFIQISRDMGYCFGIQKEGSDDVVRDPNNVNAQGEIVCVAEVPENVVLSVLQGTNDSLIHAASQAVEDCLAAAKQPIRQSLVIDCVSRMHLLGAAFPHELEAVHDRLMTAQARSAPLGMLTLGEIASSGEGYLDYLNKTIVIGLLYE